MPAFNQAVRDASLTLAGRLTGKEPCVQPTPQGDSDPIENYYMGDQVNQLNFPKEKAEALCAGCPVIAECLEYAILAKEQYGVWGGTRPQDRGHLTAQQKRRLKERTNG